MVAPGDHTIALIVIVRSDEWMILFSHQAVSIDRPLMGEPGGVWAMGKRRAAIDASVGLKVHLDTETEVADCELETGEVVED
jgi:hypothetical protein